MSTVLVTGGSGYIACYCILALCRAGYAVRATVRDFRRVPEVRAMLARGGLGAEQASAIEFFVADLESDAGWREATDGCEFVMHVASPTLTTLPKNDDEMVRPARDGVLRVLRAAREAGVKRVVLTSAFGAVGYGHKPQDRPFTEDDWTEINDTVAPYQKSKTLAERAAWEFVRNEGRGLELTAINPVGVLGPVLGPDYSPSLSLVEQMIEGRMPFAPNFGHGFVDVRDVADLHLTAMTHPQANGERFLAIAGHSLYIIEIAKILRRRLGDRAGKVPRWTLPNLLTRLLATRNDRLRAILPQLGRNLDASSEKAKRMLGWKPRSLEETIVEAAESSIKLRTLNGN